MDFNTILDFLVNPTFNGVLWWIRAVFMVVAVLLLIGVIVLLIKSAWINLLLLDPMADFRRYKTLVKKKSPKAWKTILKRLDSNKESEYKLAIIEADSFLDEVLDKMRHGGDTTEERLNNIPVAVLPSVQQLKQAHQMRNTIVHEPERQLARDEARRIIEVYEQAFKELDLLS